MGQSSKSAAVSIIALSALASAAASASADVFTVTNNNPSGAGSFAAAVTSADASGNPAMIDLNAGLGTITLSGGTSVLTNPAGVTIDGNGNVITGATGAAAYYTAGSTGLTFFGATPGSTALAVSSGSLTALAGTTINGGTGGVDSIAAAAFVTENLSGGAAVVLQSNNALINGGRLAGGTGGFSASNYGGGGGSGLLATGANASVSNTGTVAGGTGGAGNSTGGNGGIAAQFNLFGTLTNSGTVGGGNGVPANGLAGAGGAGVNFNADGLLSNSGTITGGNGSASTAGPAAGANGGNAVSFGSGGTVINSGTISGGAGAVGGNTGSANGSAGAAVFSSGAAATFTNQNHGVVNGAVTLGNFANNVTLQIGSKINGRLTVGTTANSSLTLSDDGSGGNQVYSTAVTTTQFAGQLIKTGVGTWVMDQSLNFTGGVIINGGALSVSADANLGAAGNAVSFDGNSRLRITGTAFTTLTRNLSTVAGGIDVADANNTVTASGVIGGSGYFVKAGPGTLVLTGNNTYSNTAIDAGTLRVSQDVNLGAAGTPIQIGSLSTLQATGTFSTNRNLRVYGGGGTIAVDANQTLNLTGTVFDDGALVKAGPGTLKLSGNNNYTGGTSVLGGTLTAINLPGSTTVGPQGALSPAFGVGSLSINGTLGLQPGATLVEEFSGGSALTTPGTNYDTIAGTSGSSLDLRTLGTGPGQQAVITLSNFDTAGVPLPTSTLVLGTFAGGVSLPGGFTGIDLTPLFSVNGDLRGTPSISFTGNQLLLTVPEPTGLSLLLPAAATLFRRSRRRHPSISSLCGTPGSSLGLIP